MAMEAGKAAAANITLHSMAREENYGKAKEKTPGTDREGDGAADVRITSPNTARDKMTLDKTAESALVIQGQPDQEARETATARTTLISVAREETPGKAREAAEATDIRITSPDTAREEMTPDEAAESNLATHKRLAWERLRPSSLPLPWLSSSTTRERIPSELRTFHGEVGSS